MTKIHQIFRIPFALFVKAHSYKVKDRLSGGIQEIKL
ncbi:hypothetical protein BH23BAC2_BH23BAC2_17330 [soil metagenome]